MIFLLSTYLYLHLILCIIYSAPTNQPENESSWNLDETNEMIEAHNVYKTNDPEESYDDYSCGDVNNQSGNINDYTKTGDDGAFEYDDDGRDIDDKNTHIEKG